MMVLGVKDADFHFKSFSILKELADSIQNIKGVIKVISVADAVNFVKDSENKKF